jgi:hypothetical protein
MVGRHVQAEEEAALLEASQQASNTRRLVGSGTRDESNDDGLGSSVPLPPRTKATVMSTLPTADYEHLNVDSVLDLAREWCIGADTIYRHLVLELYAAGQDAVAERFIYLTQDRVVLASEMLFLVGERLKLKLTDTPLLAQGPTVTVMLTATIDTWIASMDASRIRSEAYGEEQMTRLLNYCLNLLPADSGEYNIARQLPELVSLMKF